MVDHRHHEEGDGRQEEARPHAAQGGHPKARLLGDREEHVSKDWDHEHHQQGVHRLHLLRTDAVADDEAQDRSHDRESECSFAEDVRGHLVTL